MSTTNGNGDKVADPMNPALPENRQKVIEYGIALTQQTAHERDEALAQVNALTKQLAAMKVEIEALQSLSAAQESRAMSYQHDRDEAVARRAEYEVLLRSIQAQLREFGVQHEPLIQKKVEDDG